MSRIVIVGACSIEPNGGSFFTRSIMKKYLESFLEEYNEVSVFSFKGKADSVAACRLSEKIRVEFIEDGPSRFLTAFKINNRQPGFDLLVFMPVGILVFPLLFMRKKYKKLSCYLSSDFIDIFENKVKDRLFIAIHHAIIKRCDFIISRGQYLANLARKFNSCVYETVPIGIFSQSMEKMSQVQKRKVESLLFIGKLVRSKGIYHLVDAFINLNKKYDSLNLIIIGDGPERDPFEQYICEKNLLGNIHLKGFINDSDEIIKYYKAADLLIMPSTTHPEGVPRVIDEAIHFYLPVIATKVNGVKSEFTKGEILLIEPGSVGEIFDSIAGLIESPEKTEGLVKAGDTRRKRWINYKSAAEQHIKLFRDI